MSFSREWDEVYAQGKHRNSWPWSDLVSAVKRYTPDLKDKRVLELGCGTGGNIGFFNAQQARYIGIEGSAHAVAAALARYPSHAISVGDFTQSIPYENVDLVVDRSSITHNPPSAVKRCLDLVHDALRPGGYLISIDWFSSQHRDPTQFAEIGYVHCAEEDELRELLAKFVIVSLEEKIVRRVTPRRGQFASWNIVCQKPV